MSVSLPVPRITNRIQEIAREFVRAERLLRQEALRQIEAELTKCEEPPDQPFEGYVEMEARDVIECVKLPAFCGWGRVNVT